MSGALLAVGKTAAAQITVNVSGADDGIDDTINIRNALATPDPNQVGVTVVLEPGVYDLYKDPLPAGETQFDPFSSSNRVDLVVEGQDTVLLCHNFDPMNDGVYPKTMFEFDDIDGLTVKGLTVQYTRSPYSTGLVLGVGENSQGTERWVDIYMDEVYGDLASGFTLRRTSEFHHPSKRLHSNGVKLDPDDAPGDYEVTVTPPSPPSLPHPTVRVISKVPGSSLFKRIGDMATPVGVKGVILMHSKWQHKFSSIEDCQDVLFEDLKINDMAGLIFQPRRCHNVTFDNVDIVPDGGSVMSSTAGGITAHDCTGAFVMRNCKFKKNGDNGVDSHSRYLRVAFLDRSSSPMKVYLDKEDSGTYDPQWSFGESIQFHDDDLSKFGPLATASSDIMDNTTSHPGQWCLEVDLIPSAVVVGDWVTNDSVYPSSTLIENCNFNGNIANGVWVTGNNITIKDSTFKQNYLVAIKLETETWKWHHASSSDNVVISGCTIDGTSISPKIEGAIDIRAVYEDSVGVRHISPSGIQSHVTIKNCLFKNLKKRQGGLYPLPSATKCAIFAGAVSDLDINSNDFDSIDLPYLLRMENADPVRSDFQNCAPGWSGAHWELVNSTFTQVPPSPPVSIVCSDRW